MLNWYQMYKYLLLRCILKKGGLFFDDSNTLKLNHVHKTPI